jgi:CHASE2 domain-containing sensor protein
MSMLSHLGSELRERGFWYWVRVVAIAGIGMLLSRALERHAPGWLQSAQLPIYQLLSTSGPRQAQVGHLAIVRITDEEYWKGELAHRSPTRRDYLAALVQRLCLGGARVVALDFDLRSPVADGSLPDSPGYHDETSALAAAISDPLHRPLAAPFGAAAPSDAQPACKVVVPLTLWCPNPPDGTCYPEHTVLDDYALDPARVSWGYINLPADPRQIPVRRPNNQRDSFAQAVALADSPERDAELKSSSDFRYGSFIAMQDFERRGIVFSSRDVLGWTLEQANQHVFGKTVLIGAAWHASEYGRGPWADAHATPAGVSPGVFLQANYAAALLDNRVYPQAGGLVNVLCEVLFVAVIAIIFALPASWPRRWLWVLAVVATVAVLSYLLWQNLGIFFEATVPVILLLAHALLDEYFETRDKVGKLEAEIAALRASVTAAAAANHAGGSHGSPG